MVHARWKVGVVGIGKMGSALADALLSNGYETTVWNRTPGKVEQAVKAGAKIAPSLVDMAQTTDVLVVCLTGYAALKAALMTDELATALRGRILVNVTSMGAEEVRELGVWTGRNGISLIKGSILTYPDDVRAGKSTIIYGGPREVFDAVAPLLRAWGSRPAHIGNNLEDGSKMGLAYSCFLYPVVVGFLHGAALCHQAGISVEAYARDVILPVLQGPTLAGMLEHLTKGCLARRYDGEDMQATLNIWNLASGVGRNFAQYRLDPGLLPSAKTLMDRAVTKGFGKQDLAAVFEMLITEHSDA